MRDYAYRASDKAAHGSDPWYTFPPLMRPTRIVCGSTLESTHGRIARTPPLAHGFGFHMSAIARTAGWRPLGLGHSLRAERRAHAARVTASTPCDAAAHASGAFDGTRSTGASRLGRMPRVQGGAQSTRIASATALAQRIPYSSGASQPPPEDALTMVESATAAQPAGTRTGRAMAVVCWRSFGSSAHAGGEKRKAWCLSGAADKRWLGAVGSEVGGETHHRWRDACMRSVLA